MTNTSMKIRPLNASRVPQPLRLRGRKRASARLAVASAKAVRAAVACAIAAALVVVARAQAPQIYAITNARIVTAAGAPIESGTIVFRDGTIEQVGTGITPPASARVYDGKGLTVYPGLVDMGNTAAVSTASTTSPTARTTADAERVKRDALLHPHLRAAENLAIDAPAMRKLAAAGVTTVLAVPQGAAFSGQSALVNVALPPDEPQIGSVAPVRKGQSVLRTPVAVHLAIPENPPGEAYPNSLMGVIAFVRQSFIDAQYYGAVQERASRNRAAATRFTFDPALEALVPAVGGRVPVVYRADSVREIDRALDMSREFKLDTILAGAREADQIASELKSRNVRVIFSLRYPERLKSLAPEADEPMRTLRERANAPKAPAALEKAGIVFAFESGGLEEPKDFVKNAAKAVKAGLSADAAVRALTINAATIAGAADRLGSLEKGKIANAIVTDGDLFGEKTTIKYVFVDGRPVKIEEASGDSRRGRTSQE
jgi:imidazolonepropionase-like amidohydrolase